MYVEIPNSGIYEKAIKDLHGKVIGIVQIDLTERQVFIDENKITKFGNWIFDKNGIVSTYYRCSECGLTTPDGDIYKYCPWCGAKMR